MDKEQKQKLAAMEREILESKYGPLEPADPLPKDVIDAYEVAATAIQKYKEAALKATEGQPHYCRREVESIISSAYDYLEESLSWVQH